MTLPQLVFCDMDAEPTARTRFLNELRQACSINGSFILHHPLLPAELIAQALALAECFFNFPQAAKDALDIRHSPHFRGYSQMHNERDWREQLHIGREQAAAGSMPPWLRLQGPNQWPNDPTWKNAVLQLMRTGETIGQQLLRAIADAVQLSAQPFNDVDRSGYLLMKFICYHAQRDHGELQKGVAAHCDFSWLTLLLQDDAGGLEIQDRNGRWHPATPVYGGLVVNIGELLQYVSGGTIFAAPHRVTNLSQHRKRLSIPIFISPPLERLIPFAANAVPILSPPDYPANSPQHVHRVLPTTPASNAGAFCFGSAEWRRKGENIWCTDCCHPDR